MQAYPYLIVALVLVMTWTLVLAFELDLRVGAIGSVLALFALVAFLGWQWFRRTRKASPKEASAPASPSGLEQTSHSIRVHQASERIKETHRALANLTDSRFHDSRYALPWYLFIGPKGVGKSTIVQGSDLTYSQTTLGGHGRAARDIHNTDHLHCWLGDSAVIVDSAGRYSSKPGSLSEWRELMQAFKRLRPNHGLEAILISISVKQLQTLETGGIQELGEQLRTQVQLVNETLGSNHPIYLVLTQADHLPGFSNFAKHLEADEQKQHWGWTWPTLDDRESVKTVARTGFLEFSRIVHERCMQEVMREKDIALAEQLHRFSRGLSKIREPFITLVSALCVQSLGHDPIRIRGTHLTGQSRHQAASPNRRAPQPRVFQGTMAAISQVLPSNAPLFLSSYFRSVILPDQGMALPGRRARRFKRRRDAALAVAGLVGAMSFCTLPLLSARNNRDLQQEMNAMLRQVTAAKATRAGQAGAVPQQAWVTSARVDRRVETIDEEHELKFRFGMYQGKPLRVAARNLFLGLTLEHGITPLVAQDRFTIRELAQQPGQLTSPQTQLLRDTLYRYLLLTTPDGTPQPPIEGSIQARLVELIAGQWVQDLRISDRDQAQEVAERFIHHFQADPSLAAQRDPQLIADARSRLLRDDPMLADADALIARINQDRPPIELKDLVDPRVMTNGNQKVRAAYTRRAWEHTLQRGFDEAIERYLEDDWMLGLGIQDKRVRRKERKDRLYDHYLRAFQKEWKGFLDAIDVVTPSYEEEFIVALGDLSHPANAPIYALANALDWNLQLQSRLGKLKQAALQKANALNPVAKKLAQKAQAMAGQAQEEEQGRYMTVSLLQASFAPFVRFGVAKKAAGAPQVPAAGGAPAAASPVSGPGPDLARYLELVRSLKATLSESGYDARGRSADQRKIATLATQVETLAHEQPAAWRTWYQRVLYAPFGFARTTQRSRQEKTVEIAWCELARSLGGKIFSKYPFRKSASARGVDLVELSEFLHPKTGSLWTLQSKTLGDLITRDGSTFKRRQSAKSPTRPVNREVLTFLNAAAELAELLYPPGQDRPQAIFRVEAKPQSGIQRTTFRLGEQSYTYANGSEHSLKITWPDKDLHSTAELQVKHANGEYKIEKQGTWALFRLLEAGKVRSSPHADSIVVNWATGSGEGKYSTLYITPLQSPSLLQGKGQFAKFLSIFRNPALAVPQGLLVGSRKCR